MSKREVLKIMVNKYFDSWNSHDIKCLEPLFSKDCILRDWNISKEGIANVLDANKKIFDDVKNIKAEVLNLFVDEINDTVSAELFVHIDENEKLKVVDIISFNNVGLIKSIRAYQG